MKRLVVLAALLSAGALPATALAQTATRPTYEQPLSAQATRDVQARLRALGYYGGPIDGLWGDGTRGAVERFQRARGIAVTGELNQATVTGMGLDPDRLVSRGYAARPAAPSERVVTRVGPETTRAVQLKLRRLGLYNGPIDGVWGRSTSLALADFQRHHHLAPTGEPSRQSLVALGLDPDRHLSGSTVPTDNAAERLNRRELNRVGD
jgi:peptidoglycan hydrolase-like protein with peptidoglycan-binding domain